MKNDLLAGIGDDAGPLEKAAKLALREALDRVVVHPCDQGDDCVAARQLPINMKMLLLALLGCPVSSVTDREREQEANLLRLPFVEGRAAALRGTATIETQPPYLDLERNRAWLDGVQAGLAARTTQSAD